MAPYGQYPPSIAVVAAVACNLLGVTPWLHQYAGFLLTAIRWLGEAAVPMLVPVGLVELRSVIVVEAAMPSAVFPVLLARLYGGDPGTALRVVLSTSIAYAWVSLRLTHPTT